MILTEITKVYVHIHRSCMKNMAKLEQSNLMLLDMTEFFVRPDDVDAYFFEYDEKTNIEGVEKFL